MRAAVEAPGARGAPPASTAVERSGLGERDSTPNASSPVAKARATAAKVRRRRGAKVMGRLGARGRSPGAGLLPDRVRSGRVLRRRARVHGLDPLELGVEARVRGRDVGERGPE